MCCFSAMHTSLRRKSRDWLARNSDNVPELGKMSTHVLLFQLPSPIKIQLSFVGLEQSGPHHHLIAN